MNKQAKQQLSHTHKGLKRSNNLRHHTVDMCLCK